MLAGVGMNFAIAWFMLLILCIIGIPQLPLPGGEQQFKIASDSHEKSNSLFVSYVEPTSPAEKAGLKVRDQLVSINNTSLVTEDDLRQATQALSGQTVEVVYLRDKVETKTSVSLREENEVEASKNGGSPKGYLGVLPYEYRVMRSTWSSPVVAAGLTYQYTKITLQGLGSAIKDLVVGNASEASQNVSGPVGIFFVLKDGSSLGFRYILLIVSLLSLTLAIMNVLPIPALDGGRLFVTLLFRFLKKPLTQKVEERIHGTGFAALMMLFLIITVVDVRRFF
jgi:regulator of sigma E protease